MCAIKIRKSIKTTANLTSKSCADRFLVVISSAEAISIAWVARIGDMLPETIAMSIGSRSRTNGIQASSEARTTLAYAFGADNTRSGVSVFGSSNTFSGNTLGAATTVLVAPSTVRCSIKARETGPLIGIKVRKHRWKRRIDTSATKCRAVEARNIIGDVRDHGA
ncbi:hypothetical protein GGS21DRAFT_328668 [Xylaria nigripes]|nr:hypothetical protein GGS21DRAFT_328668 [Xylaria nigripes]